MKIARKSRQIAACALALLAGALAAAPAAAQYRHGHGYVHGHGPRVSFGFHFGAPIGWYYAPPPVVYHYGPPRVVVFPAEPTVYVEREVPATAPSAAPASSYWYYCGESRAYYPYVRDCPGGWERVPPRPQP